MAKRIINNIKLGAFVAGGLLFLILLLYMIGKNRSLFGATYVLKARFEHVQGLVAGNNVRYAGIEVGTVKKISILNDTLIEVTLLVDKNMKNIIRRNAIVSIGTEGFVGNKVVNIIPSKQPGSLAVDGDLLVTKKAIDTDELLQTLSKTNQDVAVIAAELKITAQRLNNSSNGLWQLLNDASIPQQVKASVGNIRAAAVKANEMVSSLNIIITDVKNGKGSAGMILRDSAFANNLTDAVSKIKNAGTGADSLAAQITNIVNGIRNDINNGKGPAHAILRDSAMVQKLNSSLYNIQKGTDNFNQNMEALKHSIFLRGYFRKLEKQKMEGQNKK
ncbi:MAG: MlaD family protein [Chitinophagaceae bacterium]|nr:MlaD family protein [Chitinophagaceae bacterium]